MQGYKRGVGEKENEVAEERDGMGEAIKQEFLMTYDPALGYIPTERLLPAVQYAERLARSSRTNDLAWQERGPNNIAGRTRALFIDTRDASGNTIFAGSVSGGIWKCTNFKSTPVWTPVSENMGSLAVCALAQDPVNKNIMYAGTGEGWFNIDAVRGNGIWKSTDGGTTWNQLGSTDSTANGRVHNFDYIQDIVVNSSGFVFATSRPSRFCNSAGVLRSTDGGASWTTVIGALKGTVCDSAYNFYGSDLELSTNGDIYATTGSGVDTALNLRGRIFRSPSASAGSLNSWVDITPAGTWKRVEIAVSPSQPSNIYALLQGTGNSIGAIKKSTNFGASWVDLPLPTWCNQGTNSPDFTNNQAFYDLIVAVDPNDNNTVVIGGVDLFKSTNGGTTWNQITQWSGNCASLPQIHADQHNVIFYPGSSAEFIASNDGGVYYTANSGSTWANKNAGYNTSQLYGCAIHPTSINYFLIGTQDNGSQKLQTTAVAIGSEVSKGGDGGFAHIDQTNGGIQVISNVYNKYFYSRDNGATFSNIVSFNDNGRFINPSDYDNAKKVLYSASSPNELGLILNLNGTSAPTFTAVSINSLSGTQISAVKVDPTVAAGGTIWIAGSTGKDATTSAVPVVVKLSNANTTTPTVVTTATLPVAAGSYVSSIDVDPANANHLLVTISNYGVVHVLESTNAGTSWSSIVGNLPDVPVRWGMFVPANASVAGTATGGILLATEIGVWYTPQPSGASTTWTTQNGGLPRVRVDMLKYRASDNLVAAATHGRGLFTTNLTGTVTAVNPVLNTTGFIQYVSASKQQLYVKAGNLTGIKSITVNIFDLSGKLVFSKIDSYSSSVIPISHLSSGSYVVKVYGDKKQVYSQQFLK